MIRPELKREIESIADRLNENDEAERATKSVLSALLGAIDVNQERMLDRHVLPFTERLLRALSEVMARGS